MTSHPDLDPAFPPRSASQAVLFWVLALALPLVLLFTMEVWLQTTYTRGLFHLHGFEDMYNTGIFRYRILGRLLLLKTYAGLLCVLPNQSYPMPGDPEATLPFVLAYAVLNGLGFFLANFLTLCLLWTWREGLRVQVLPLYFFVLLLNCISMAVVTPYDQLAYFLLLLAGVGARIKSAMLSYGLVLLSALAGTLNRETEFLATALLAALAFSTTRKRSRRLWGLAIVHLATCLSVYVALRVKEPGAAAIANPLTWGGKWALPAGMIVLSLGALALVLADLIYSTFRPAIAFLVLSLPYLLTVLLTGALRELRLLVPLLFCLLVLYDTLSRWSSQPFQPKPLVL